MTTVSDCRTLYTGQYGDSQVRQGQKAVKLSQTRGGWGHVTTICERLDGTLEQKGGINERLVKSEQSVEFSE